jgi:hypothetical protein
MTEPRRRGTVLLGVAAALLLVVSIVSGVGYARSRREVAAQKRALAARTAERDRLLVQLDEVRARRVDLETKLATAQAGALDPAGYEKIKKCVHEYADAERAVAKYLREGGQPGQLVLVPGSSGAPLPSACVDAEPYLK